MSGNSVKSDQIQIFSLDLKCEHRTAPIIVSLRRCGLKEHATDRRDTLQSVNVRCCGHFCHTTADLTQFKAHCD